MATSCKKNSNQTILIDAKNGTPVCYAGKFSDKKVQIPIHYIAKPQEMRGIWVSTVWNIDFAQHKTEKAFKKDYCKIICNLEKNNFNAVFFQIRTKCDAFYSSKLNPWSRYLTGKEGRDIPGFEPLDYMIRQAHNHGIEFHAWLNPYRVTSNQKKRKEDYLKTLAPNNFARLHPECVLEADHHNGRYSLLLDPGNPTVQKYILDTIREIALNFPVDGIHFDDYFYLYKDNDQFDAESFQQFNPQHLTLESWRRDNINQMVSSIHQLLSELNEHRFHYIAFGISPFGIWANKTSKPEGSLTAGGQSYFQQYADSKYWIDHNLVDYIVPQLYWKFSHNIAAYACLADWWSKAVKGSNVHLYIGQGAYRMDSKDWSPDELPNQLRYNTKREEINGSVFFSYRSFFGRNATKHKKTKKTIFQKYWKSKVPAPKYKQARF